MIPRRVFWLFDLGCLSYAFMAAYWLVPHLLQLLESAGLFQSAWVQSLSPPPFEGMVQLPPLSEMIWALCIMALSVVIALSVFGNHRSLFEQSYTHIVGGSVLASLSGVSLIALVLFAVKHPPWSRVFIFSFGLLSSLGLGAYRIALRIYFGRRLRAGYYAKHVVLLSARSGLQWMADYFRHVPFAREYRLLGYLHLGQEEPSTPSGAQPLSCLGNVHELGELLVHHPISDVIVVYPASGGTWLRQVIQDCDYLGVRLHIVPEALLFEKHYDLRVLSHSEPLHLPAVILSPPHHWDSEALFLKRLFDIAVSAVLLVMLSPLFGLIALAIKLTTPQLPILYRWSVVGRNGAPFTGYKFTTMVADADQLRDRLHDQNEMTGPVFKIQQDPRVTPLGRFLRKYSLNELPQLWSVLKGDMSLVGPRPAFPHELERYAFWHKRKLSVKPGITCLWQVHGRNAISDFDEWVRLDLEYIERWSLWLDLKILARTAWAVVAGTGS